MTRPGNIYKVHWRAPSKIWNNQFIYQEYQSRHWSHHWSNRNSNWINWLFNVFDRRCECYYYYYYLSQLLMEFNLPKDMFTHIELANTQILSTSGQSFNAASTFPSDTYSPACNFTKSFFLSITRLTSWHYVYMMRKLKLWKVKKEHV